MAAAAGPDARVEFGEVGEVEQRRTVSDRRIDDLAPAGDGALVDRHHYSQRGEQRAAGEIAQHGQRRYRTVVPDHSEGARDRRVVDVVSGSVAVGTVLSPAGQPRVDEPRIAFAQHVRAQAAAFHRAGAVALQQDIGGVGKSRDDLGPARRPQIHHDRPFTRESDLAGSKGCGGAGRSTAITSAPKSASSIEQKGPGPNALRSSTRTPVSGGTPVSVPLDDRSWTTRSRYQT